MSIISSMAFESKAAATTTQGTTATQRVMMALAQSSCITTTYSGQFVMDG